MAPFFDDIDQSWEWYGSNDPYFGNIASPGNEPWSQRYHPEGLTAELRAEFFASGKRHMARVFDTIHAHVDPAFRASRILDFGCGVGRLLVPLSEACEEIVGVDVSASMLAEARRNCPKARLIKLGELGDDERFDLIHSQTVFQHIPVAQGEKIIAHLLRHLAPGGVAALQVSFANASLLKRLTRPLRRVRLAHYLYNAVKGQPLRRPMRQLNCYSLERLMVIFVTVSPACYLWMTNHDGLIGAMFLVQKERNKLAVRSPAGLTNVPALE
ncbi:MAG: class I SAM-dependent methyltransferase [Candidatus Binataceae bacterium]